MSWKDVKEVGSTHYKTLQIEPIDLYKSGELLQDFAIGNIIKYAFRNRSVCKYINISDMNKIIHYAQILITIKEEEEELNNAKR